MRGKGVGDDKGEVNVGGGREGEGNETEKEKRGIGRDKRSKEISCKIWMASLPLPFVPPCLVFPNTYGAPHSIDRLLDFCPVLPHPCTAFTPYNASHPQKPKITKGPFIPVSAYVYCAFDAFSIA